MTARPDQITIGRAAALSGLTAKAIRLYERIGLVKPGDRSAAGYRTYGPEDIAVLTFIRRAKTLGLRLTEIGEILDLQRNGGKPCNTVLELLAQRIAAIDRTMADLRLLRHAMTTAQARATQAASSGDNAVVCHLIETDE